MASGIDGLICYEEWVKPAFAHLPHPDTCIRDPFHCEECREHEETLREHTAESVTLDQLGNPGWDPICFVDDEGFRYYLRGMLRLVLENVEYLDQLLFHLNCEGRLDCLEAGQREAVRRVLVFLVEERSESLPDPYLTDGLLELVLRLEPHDPESS